MSTSIRRLSLSLTLSLFAAGCASKPYAATFQKPSFVLQDEGPASAEKSPPARIRVQVVTREQLMEAPELVRRISWREVDRDAPVNAEAEPGSQSLAPTVLREGLVSLVPLPAWALQIENQGEAPLTVRSAVLTDDSGKSYVLLEDETERIHRTELSARALSAHILSDSSLVDWLRAESRAVPLLRRGLEVPKGGVWKGYAAFDLGAFHPEDYYAWVKQVQTLTLKLSTSAQDAEQTFVFEKSVQPVAVTCPGKVKEPSLESCTPSSSPVQATEVK